MARNLQRRKLIDKAVARLLDEHHFLEYRQGLIEADVSKWKTKQLKEFLGR